MAEKRTILVTGANRGLGLATSIRLARDGHRLVLSARDEAKAAAAVAAVRGAVPGAAVLAGVADLGDQASVRRFAAWLGDTPVDAVLHNAGNLPAPPRRELTADGVEVTLAVHVLGPFLLTSLLLPVLSASGRGRVVCVGSGLHDRGGTRRRGGPHAGRGPVTVDLDDVMLERGYDPDTAYRRAKLAVLWFCYELQRRLGPVPVTANAVAPGFVPATIARNAHGLQRFMLVMVLPRLPVATSVADAAAAMAWVVADESLDGVGGKYFQDRVAVPSSAQSYEQAKAAAFWDLAETLTGTGHWPGALGGIR